ncbi:MAG: caspase family protein [Actinomycetota bacterium]
MRAELEPAIDPGTHRGAVTSILVPGDGGFFVTVGCDRRVRVWEPGRPTPRWTVVGRPGRGRTGRPAAALHPARPLLAIAVDDRTADDRAAQDPTGGGGQDWSSLLWICDLDARLGPDLSAGSTRRNAQAAADDSDRSSSRPVVRTYRWPEPIRAVAYDPTGAWLLVAGERRLLALDADDPAAGPDAVAWPSEAAARVELEHEPVDLVVGACDGAPRAFVTSLVGGVRAFDLVDGHLEPAGFELRADAEAPAVPDLGPIDRLAVRGPRLALAGRRGPVVIGDLDGGSMRAVTDAGGGRGGSLAFADQGDRLVVGSRIRGLSVVTVHDITSAGEDDPTGGDENGGQVGDQWDGDRRDDEGADGDESVLFAPIGGRLYDAEADAVGFLDRGTVVSAGGTGQWIDEWAAWTFPEDPRLDAEAADATIAGVGRSVTAVGIDGTRIGFEHPLDEGVAEFFDQFDDEFERVGNGSPAGVDWFDLAVPDLVDPSIGRSVDPATGSEHGGPEHGDAIGDETGWGRASRRRHERDVATADGTRVDLLTVEEDDGDPHLVLSPAGLRLTGHGRYRTSTPTAWSFVGDRAIVVAERDGHLRLLRETADGEIVGRLLAVGGRVLDVAVDDRWLVVGGDDQTVRLWSLDHLGLDDLDGDPDDPAGIVPPTLSLFVTTDGEWVLWSPGGYYTASTTGDRHLVFHLDRGETEVPLGFAADRFSRHFYRPAVIREIVATGSEAEALATGDVPDFDPADNLPPVIDDVEIAEDDDAANVRFRVVDVGGPPATRVAIVHNGMPVWEASPGGHDDDEYEAWVWLDPGANEIRIVAENEVAKATPQVESLRRPGSDDEPAPAGDRPPGFARRRPWAVSTPTYEEALVEVGVEYDTDTDTETDTAPDVGEWVDPVPDEAVEVWGEPNWEDEEEPLIAASVELAAPPPVEVRTGSVRFDLATTGESDTELVAAGNGVDLWRATVVAPARVELALDLPVVDGENVLRVDATDDSGTWSVAETRLTVGPRQPGDGITPGFDEPAPAPPAADPGQGRATTPETIETADPFDDEDHPPVEHTVRSGTGGPQRMGALQAGPPGHGGSAALATDPMTARAAGGAGPTGRPPRPTEEDPHLFLLSIGVSDLVNDQGPLADLRYAADDALELGSRFSAGRSGAFANVWRRVLVDGAATKTGIEAALTELEDAVRARTVDKAARNVRSRDVVLFFFAGHGITHRGDNGTGDRFYMVAHDHDDDRVPDTGVDFDFIGRTLSGLNAEVIVLIDACHSGAALPGLYERSNPVELAKQLQLARDRTLYIVSATTSDEKAWEHELLVPYERTGRPRTRVGHGFFTHAILRKVDAVDRTGESLSLLTLIGGVQDALDQWTSRRGWEHVKQRPKARIEGQQIPRLEIYEKRRGR